MGLDVYLYRYEDKDAYEAWEQAEEAEYTRLYDANGRAATEEQRDRWLSQLDAWKAAHPEPRREKIERDSAVHSDHMFKVGYFRSSYNDGGIERVFANAIGARPLDYIFDRGEKDDYKFQPNWGEALKRAREMAAAWRAHTEKAKGTYVTRVTFNMFTAPESMPRDEKTVMDMFLRERERERNVSFETYSNRDGEFFMGEKGLHVRAMIPGVEDSIMARLHGGQGLMPCMYVVAERDQEKGGDWYAKAIDVVIETCEWALGQPDADKLWMHWSG